MTRRTFSATLVAASAAFAQKGKPIRLGAPIFLKSDDPEALAREHQRLGYTAAQCPPVTLQETAKIEAIRKAYAARNVVIAECGAWVNILHPDPATRKKNLDYATERMALADAVGARCSVDTAGSLVEKGSADPRNMSKEFFDGTVENCRKIIDAAKPKRARWTIEMMFANLPDTADSYVELIKAVDRKEFGVHMDVCNVLNSPTKYYHSGEYIDELFKKLGPWVVSCHAKDLRIAAFRSLQFVEVVPGRGIVDYKAYLRNLSQVPLEAPLMMEHFANDEEYQEGAAYIRKQGTEIGISFV
ncbi:MAG TPA: sugar phosphate isomerase/epimerase [Bryobacteraceae bacterium]|nr:sugar phosphate isomerase/epimerase [Bryobacteraceae bacterium]